MISNIEEMEKAYKMFNESKINTMGRKWGVEDFMENCINELKDLHDSIARLEKTISEELIKNDISRIDREN